MADFTHHDVRIQSVQQPKPSQFSKKTETVRRIDVDPPKIYGYSKANLKRISATRILTDSTHHQNGEIKNSAYSPELKKLFTLDALSFVINVFGRDCKKIQEIVPAASRDNRDLIIINFEFSEKTLRVITAI